MAQSDPKTKVQSPKTAKVLKLTSSPSAIASPIAKSSWPGNLDIARTAFNDGHLYTQTLDQRTLICQFGIENISLLVGPAQ